jgi:hypothetical protein
LTDSPENDVLNVATDIESAAGRSVPEDELLAERLGVPSTPVALYLEEASHYRPISTGDIFKDAAVPGSTTEEAAHDLTMVIAHPSAMRKGANLEARARAAPVAPVDGLSRKKWSRGHFNVFPLPLLSTVAKQNGFEIDDRGWGALLELAAPVETAQFDVNRRVACLAPEGVHLLLQRLVHADTRFPVREDTLAHTFAPKLEELEMLQTWNEDLVAPRVGDGADLIDELRSAATAFDEVLGDDERYGAGGMSLRAMLESETHAGEAHRRLAAEIRRRKGEV